MNKMQKILIVSITILYFVTTLVLIQLFIGMIQDHKCYTGEETREEICSKYE